MSGGWRGALCASGVGVRDQGCPFMGWVCKDQGGGFLTAIGRNGSTATGQSSVPPTSDGRCAERLVVRLARFVWATASVVSATGSARRRLEPRCSRANCFSSDTSCQEMRLSTGHSREQPLGGRHAISTSESSEPCETPASRDHDRLQTCDCAAQESSTRLASVYRSNPELSARAPVR